MDRGTTFLPEIGFPFLYRTHKIYMNSYDLFDKRIFIHRNPLDTLISSYYFYKNREVPFLDDSVKIRENDIWDATIFQKHLQVGEDLGIRMLHAFKNGFETGYEKVLIIGSDLYDLTAETIENAFIALENNEVVIGPAEDGGYYLLGMNSLEEKVFKNKDWGTETVRKDTLEDLKDKKVFLLGELNDVDVFEDIKHHPAFQIFLK